MLTATQMPLQQVVQDIKKLFQLHQYLLVKEKRGRGKVNPDYIEHFLFSLFPFPLEVV